MLLVKTRKGKAEVIAGSPVILLTSKVRKNFDSNYSHAYEYLIIMSPDDTIKITWEGDARHRLSALVHDGDGISLENWEVVQQTMSQVVSHTIL